MRQRALAYFLLAPAFAIVAFTTVYPMLSSFWTSFHVLNLARSVELGRFVGLQNYQDAFFDDPEFWTVMRVTATFVVIDVALTMLVALGLAILLLRAGFGKSILRTLLILPFAMSPALIGISWRFMLNPEFGAFNRSIAAVIPALRDFDYLANPVTAMGALITADVWHWAPYFTFMLMGGPRRHSARDAGSGAHRWCVELAAIPRRDPAAARAGADCGHHPEIGLRAESVRQHRHHDRGRPGPVDHDARLLCLSYRLS